MESFSKVFYVATMRRIILQHFLVVLFIIQYRVVQTLEFVDEIIKSNYSED